MILKRRPLIERLVDFLTDLLFQGEQFGARLNSSCFQAFQFSLASVKNRQWNRKATDHDLVSRSLHGGKIIPPTGWEKFLAFSRRSLPPRGPTPAVLPRDRAGLHARAPITLGEQLEKL